MDSEARLIFSKRLSPAQLIGLDVALAVVYTVFVVLYVLRPTQSDLPVAARVAIVVAITAPLAVRRLWPWPVFAVVTAATLTSTLLGVAEEPFFAAGFALYMVALLEPRPPWEPTVGIAIASGVVAICTSMAGTRTWWADDIGGTLFLGVAMFGLAWTMGRAVRERRAYAAREAERRAEEAVASERLRIARELHDVVAHSIGVIAVKASVANHIMEHKPDESRDALRVIESASRSALTELRHLLGVLRPGEPLAPTPGVADLPPLVERAGLSGVRASLDVSGVDGHRLPEGVGLAVYRIVQEALTNVVKHVAPARATVRVAGTPGLVTVEVVDDGAGHRFLPATGMGGPGHGLIGMRERVAMYGGEFSAGSVNGGGFRVWATLPYGEPGEGAA